MRFTLTEQQEAFRQEVLSFVKQEIPPDWTWAYWDEHISDDKMWEASCEIARKLGERGWLALNWPKEYGGLERSHVDKSIFSHEVAYHRVPGIDLLGVNMLAPAIMAFGTDEQKKKFLPPIASGEMIWCEGYSEPGAGSDLASLRTSAVDKGDHYVINGQKIWTSQAHRADWCFLLARSDPDAPKKYMGISLFLIDMKTPGIEVRPIVNMLGGHSFNEVFLEDVKVPAENILGGANNGWLVGNMLLAFERSSMYFSAIVERHIDDLIRFVTEDPSGREILARNPNLRHELAEMHIAAKVGELINYNVAWMQDNGLSPDSEAAQAKLFVSELLQQVAALGMRILGLYGPLRKGSARAYLSGMMAEESMDSIGMTIAAGTSEIMRTIIATRGLGLPRG